MTTNTIAWIAGTVAVVSVGLAYHYHKQLRGMMPIPPPTPTLAQAKAAQAVNALAAAQVTKGAKAIAEAAKVAQIGEVRAQDRAADKAILKGG